MMQKIEESRAMRRAFWYGFVWAIGFCAFWIGVGAMLARALVWWF